MKTTQDQRNRRGVLLLLVLGMLAMFGLIAITFVLLAGHHQRGAEIAKTIEQNAVRPETLLNEALQQTLTGSTDAASPLRIHGLFEDMYGSGATTTRIGSDPAFPAIAAIELVAGGQIVELLLGRYDYYDVWQPLATPGDYVGRVITFTSGLAAGKSTRIVDARTVGSGPSGPIVRVQILAKDWPSIYGNDGQPGRAGIDDDNNGTVDDATENGWPLSDDYFHRSLPRPITTPYDYRYLDAVLINGADFSGTGAGLGTPYTSANFGNWPYAFLPNPAFTLPTPYNPSYSNANEDYDAVDFQNMLLAAMRPETTTSLGNGEPRVVIPSLHRAALVNYAFQQMHAVLAGWLSDPAQREMVIFWPYGVNAVREPTGGDEDSGPWSSVPIDVRDEIAQLKRKFIFRPLREDNPSFTGSNSRFRPNWDGLFVDNLPTGPPPGDGVCDYAWDVDNDGDGLPDGIWVDLGYPARSAPDGRLYKPLFSFLCIDLDGRLNVNAHGSLAQTNAGYYSAIDSTDRGAPSLRPYFATTPTAALTAALPRGQGFGPADINLGTLFGDGDLPNYAPLLTAYANLVTERYRSNLSSGGSEQVPGASGDDPLSQNLAFQYWNECWRESNQFLNLAPAWTYDFWKYYYDTANYARCGYGTAFDMHGNGAVGLDVRGTPIYAEMCNASAHVDDPYEMNLFHPANDRPYSVADLERLLRRFDHDATRLPQNLAPFLSPMIPAHATEVTTEITTASFDVPVAGSMLTQALQGYLNTHWATISATTQTALRTQLSQALPNTKITHLLTVRLARGLEDSGVASADIPGYVATLRMLFLSPELRSGLKMDLNAPFGNGIDDDGDGVVDEPARLVRNNPIAPDEFVVDSSHPGELSLAAPKNYEKMPQVTSAGSAVTDATMWHSRGIDVNADGALDAVDAALARQHYARQLYVLLLLLMDHQVADPTNPTAVELARAKFAAQWAANVVDFCDRDATMTPFEYDVSPFTDEGSKDNSASPWWDSATKDGNTWDVDGVIDTNPTAACSDDDQASHPWRRLVWGTERPELLITETLAFHDIATEDMKVGWDPNDDYHYNPDDPMNPDVDLDQQKRPRGSLFVELYNPSTLQDPPTTEIHHASQGGVDLAKVAPGTSSPVWRLAIFDDENRDLDPDDHTVTPERSVYFATMPGGGFDIPATQDGLQHYPSTAPTTSVSPGRYAVIGPGDNDLPSAPTTTYIGLRTGASQPDGSTRRIELPDGGSITNLDVLYNRSGATGDLQALRTANRIQAPVTVAVNKANVQSGFQATTDNLRLSVSEPEGGYPTKDAGGTDDFDTANQVYTLPFVTPLDQTHNATNWPFLVNPGTYVGFRVVHLQRLANPSLAWHGETNPYITVDTTLVDLTAFNGTPETVGHEGPEPVAASPPYGPDIDPSDDDFFTRERGDNSDADGEDNDDATTAANTVWRTEPLVDRDFTPTFIPLPLGNGGVASITGHAYTPGLEHTLGYLNYDLNEASGTPRNSATPSAFHAGDPAGTPFPWLSWNNRPFVSPLELLHVPTLSPARLLRHPRDADVLSEYPYGKAFQVLATAAAVNPYADANVQFPHLTNFFLSVPSGDVPHSLAALLDWVDVPSPFVGSQVQANPYAFGASAGHEFRTPFNRFSNWREPGLVNINTIFSENVWKGVVNYLDTNGVMNTAGGTPWKWAELQTSRRGSAAGSMFQFDTTNYLPSRFANPFRSAGTSHLVPPVASGELGPPPQGGVQRPIDATLMRVSTGGTNAPLFQFESAANLNNTNRNPYFRYQMLQKLSNLITTRSNVYAIWITVGFFEVEPWPPSALTWPNADYTGVAVNPHPDGYSLGNELGMDTGEIERHRAFFIIDRSIPVGFIRGRDLNSDKAILLKRFIE